MRWKNQQGRLPSIPDRGPAAHTHAFELQEREWKGVKTHHSGPGSICRSPLGDPGRKPPFSSQTPMREDGHVQPLAPNECCQAKSECLLSTYYVPAVHVGRTLRSHCTPMRRHYTPDLLRVTLLLGRVTEPPEYELKQSVLGAGRVTKFSFLLREIWN